MNHQKHLENLVYPLFPSSEQSEPSDKIHFPETSGDLLHISLHKSIGSAPTRHAAPHLPAGLLLPFTGDRGLVTTPKHMISTMSQ